MKVAVIGANGQLGSDLVTAFTANGDVVRSLTHAEIEIGDPDSVKACLESDAPEIVVNTAAMHHVDKCEQAPTAAYGANAIGARNLAQVTRDLDAALVHISTDYVFDGGKQSPYEELDAPCPLNVYGNSKLAGEYYARTLNPKHFVVRTSALYGTHQCRAKGGKNFVDLMLHLARTRGHVRVVNDEFVTPTPTAHLARQIVSLGQSSDYGLYHATSEGNCSWYEFAREIFAQAGLAVNLEAAQPGEFPAKAPRPRYSVLENRRLKELGINCFTSWQSGLQQYLTEIKTASAATEAA
jgi:dTDP-4-dehydrorhamnose reductase